MSSLRVESFPKGCRVWGTPAVILRWSQGSACQDGGDLATWLYRTSVLLFGMGQQRGQGLSEMSVKARKYVQFLGHGEVILSGCRCIHSRARGVPIPLCTGLTPATELMVRKAVAQK